MEDPTEEFEALCDATVLEYAATVSPRIWHQMAMDWNWDGGLYFFQWLLNNPGTDRATALMMYWMAGPRWYKQVANHAEAKALHISLKSFDFIEEIEAKYLVGSFTNSRFAYDPAHDHDGYDWTKEYADNVAVREIPPIMFQKLIGETVEKPIGFIEGMPEPLASRIDAMLDAFLDEEE